MAIFTGKLPEVGDPAPAFEVETSKGLVRFPEFSAGCWCILFCHPANFTTAWRMYSTFMAWKERWLNERNTKLLALSTEIVRNSDWTDKVRRYIGIYLKAPVIEDLNLSITDRFGMASKRRRMPEFNRLAYIIDPQGIIRMIIEKPLTSIELALTDLESEFDRLLGKTVEEGPEYSKLVPGLPLAPPERSDAADNYNVRPAYFGKKKLNLN